MWCRYNPSGHKFQPQQKRLQNGGGDVNPIYLSPEFREYRMRQAEKPDQKWPDLLEDAFLDALLLIPQMGRSKFSMKKQLYGRNMLISEYLWIAYLHSLPPGAEPNPLEWRRGRKQISSHIQVLKSFFTHHRCCHLLFGKEKDKNPNLQRCKKRKGHIKSKPFNTNPVLIALSENRLPEVRLNYDYLGQLLASDALVTVRPHTCWIYVSNKRDRDHSDKNKPDGFEGLVDKSVIPYGYNLNCLEDRPRRDKEDLVLRETLLHIYTRTMKQCESTSVRDFSREWKSTFPELNEAFRIAAQDYRCDILHMHATLDLHTVDGVPDGSYLNGMVDITITQPALRNHRWKVVTRLARPSELCGGSEAMLCKMTDDIGELFQHCLGCDDLIPYCSCMRSRSGGDIFHLPFPAQQWAAILGLSAQYPPYPEVGGAGVRRNADAEGQKQRAKSVSYGPDHLPEHRKRKRPYEQDEDEVNDQRDPVAADDCLTQLDLIRKVGMLQELWSRPRKAHEHQGWTRRAIIAWTFDRCHPRLVGRNKTVMLNPGTEWRFVTALDSDSPEHQEKMFVAREETVQSYPPLHQHQLGDMETEDFISAPDISRSAKQKQDGLGAVEAHHPHMDKPPTYALDGIGVIDSFPSGLATPPLSAALLPAFAGSHDASAMELSDQSAQNIHYLPAHKSISTSVINTLNSDPGAFGTYGPASDACVVKDTSWKAPRPHGASHQADSVLDWTNELHPDDPNGSLSNPGWDGVPVLKAGLLALAQHDWNTAASDHWTLLTGAIAPASQRLDAEMLQRRVGWRLEDRTLAVEGGELVTQPVLFPQRVPWL